jgi:hypothetical protein
VVDRPNLFLAAAGERCGRDDRECFHLHCLSLLYRFLALCPVRDLLLCAKHLFVAAKVARMRRGQHVTVEDDRIVAQNLSSRTIGLSYGRRR